MGFTRLLFSFVLSAASATAAIDFSPTVLESEEQGFLYRSVTLKRDGGTATFFAPLGWSIRGDRSALKMAPPKKDFAEAIIRASPLVVQTFDEATLAALGEIALAAAPPTSQSVQLVGRTENVVAFGNKSSVEFVLSYQMFGRLFKQSLLFVNPGELPLVFQLMAPAADFDALSQTFHRSISSWQLVTEEAAPSQTKS